MAVLHTDPLQGLVIVTSDIRIWSGGVKLTREGDLSTVRDKLPPSAMVSDGRKNLVKPSALAPFHAIRKRLERLLSRQGFRLMSDAFAVPEAEIDSIIREMDTLEEEFNEAVPVFLNDLPAHYQAQMDEFPEWSEQLKSGQLEESKVAERLRFSAGVYKIAPPDPVNAESKLNRQYSNVVNSAVPALLNDIAAKAETLLKGPVGKRQCVTQVQHAQVRKLVERLEAFSFLDYRVGPTAEALTSMLDCVPRLGSLTPGNTAVIRVVVEQLADPETLLEVFEASDEPVNDANTVSPVDQPAVQVPVTAPSTPAFVGV